MQANLCRLSSKRSGGGVGDVRTPRASGVVLALPACGAAVLTWRNHMQNLCRRGRRGAGVLGLVLALSLSASTPVLALQEVAAEDAAVRPGQRNGYTVRKADEKFINAVDDFARYRDKKEWEKAFRSLATVTTVDAKLMAPSKDGFMLPVRQRVTELLVTLPPEGREAYRLFNDAPAKQLYEQALAAGQNSPAEEVPLLRKVVDQYFVATMGDQAADRLADALFESGDFLGAEALWATIAEKYPDLDLDLNKLQVKRGVAMARGKRWEALQGLISQIKEKSGGASVTIGGQEVVAADYLESLVEPTTQPVQVARNADGSMALPSSDTPSWQCSFLEKDILQKIGERVNNWGWQGMMGHLTNFVPTSDTDGKRVYVNWLGACFAVDAATGKMVWRTDKFEDITQRIDQLVQSMPDVTAYSTVVISPERVVFVRVPVKRINYDEPIRLTCHDSNTGQQKWSSENGTLSSYEFVGRPVVIDEQLIAPAKNRNGSDLMLLTIDPANGKMISSITIGQGAAGSNWRGNTVMPSPDVQKYQGKLYVLTNNGGVVCVNPATKSLEWAFQCEGP